MGPFTKCLDISKNRTPLATLKACARAISIFEREKEYDASKLKSASARRISTSGILNTPTHDLLVVQRTVGGDVRNCRSTQVVQQQFYSDTSVPGVRVTGQPRP